MVTEIGGGVGRAQRRTQATMFGQVRQDVLEWQGREFVFLSGEGTETLAPGAAMGDLLARFERTLQSLGHSLEQTVRTRLWARDRSARSEASQVRLATLSGARRSASSSYLAPGYLASGAPIALDLVAVRPRDPNSRKTVREFEPPSSPPRYIVFEDLVEISGAAASRTTIEEEIEDILAAMSDNLRDAGSDWDRVVSVGCYVHRSVVPGLVREHLRRLQPALASVERVTYSPVDGFANEGRLIEIEMTARQ